MPDSYDVQARTELEALAGPTTTAYELVYWIKQWYKLLGMIKLVRLILSVYEDV